MGSSRIESSLITQIKNPRRMVSESPLTTVKIKEVIGMQTHESAIMNQFASLNMSLRVVKR